MNVDILGQFQELYEKQDILSKLTNAHLYSTLSYSQIHSLSAIAFLDEPNATQIASQLQITRGAISKVMKKLLEKELIVSFQKPDNKKEKFYRLTKEGKQIDMQHRIAHEAWERRDLPFLQSIPENVQNTVSCFLEQFNRYLEQQIKEKTT